MPTTTMTGVTEVLWLGLLLGVGSALAVGPIFVVIVQQAATSGFAASFRVILGSATADLLLLLPALAFTWVLGSAQQGALWVGAVGAVFLCWLAWQAARDAVALWRQHRRLVADGRWAFWKGVAGNLANPLTWTFWLATGTPAMLAARRAGGMAGLALFTATWVLVASGLEGGIALAVARSHSLAGGRAPAGGRPPVPYPRAPRPPPGGQRAQDDPGHDQPGPGQLGRVEALAEQHPGERDREHRLGGGGDPGGGGACYPARPHPRGQGERHQGADQADPEDGGRHLGIGQGRHRPRPPGDAHRPDGHRDQEPPEQGGRRLGPPPPRPLGRHQVGGEQHWRAQ